MDCTIRIEVPDDFDAIDVVTTRAFAESEFGEQGEAELIRQLRTSGNHLSLVAERNATIVGHILFSPVTILAGGNELPGMGLGPMSVIPDLQRKGIGSSLVKEGLDRLKKNQIPFIAVLGHPEFYSRCGFQTALDFNIRHGFAGIAQDYFFIKLLRPDCESTIANGLAYYADEFGPQHGPADD